MNQTTLHKWKRYWYSGSLPLQNTDFSPDPDSHWGAIMYPNLAQLDALKDVQCLVLLGEPGLGKSVVVRQHVAGLRAETANLRSVLFFDLKDFGSEASLIRNLFDSTAMLEWAKGTGTIELYLDSLDEGMLNIETLAGFLAQEFQKLDRQRLRIRLICRSAVWPRSFEEQLAQLWPNGVSVYRLAPLRLVDVQLAAKSVGLPAEEVISAILRSSAESFARKPLTLKMLLEVYGGRGSLPESIVTLYKLGIHALATESNVSRQENLKVGHLTTKQRVAVAERIAAVTTFCNRRIVGVHSANELVVETEIAGQDIHGNEAFESGGIEVNASTLRELLDTALFRWKQAGQAEWDHLSHAEYLAAAYCVRHRVPLSDLKRLVMTSVDGHTRVAPQLRETAAWLSAMLPDFRDYLLHADPLVLLSSDVTTLSLSDRKILAGQVLNVNEEELWSLSVASGQLSGLQHPSLADQLRPYLTDRKKPVAVRRFAMDIVRDCRVDLDSDLLAVAGDATEVPHLRSHAAFVLSEVAQEPTKEKLLELLDRNNDLNDEVKGWCLTALWPDHLGVSELLQHLTPPKNDHFTGAYKAFLYKLADSLPERLLPDAIPAAMEWVRKQQKEEFPEALSRVQDSVILGAWNQLNAIDDVAKSLARVVADRLSEFEPVLRGRDSDSQEMNFSSTTASDTSKRRLLISALIKEFADRHLDPGDLFRSRDRLIYDDDIHWLISERLLCSETEAEVILKALLAAQRTSAVLDAIAIAVADGRLPNDFLRFLYVEFGSLEEKSQRSAYAQYLWYERRHARYLKRKLSPSPLERIEHDLKQIEAGKTEWWPQLAQDLTLTETSRHYDISGKPLTELPGWRAADVCTRARIVAGAKCFVLDHEPRADQFIGQSTFPGSVIAAYEALSLIADSEIEFVASQDAIFWRKWLPLVLWYPFDHQKHSEATLVAIAASRAREFLPEAVLMMTRADQHDVSRCLTKVDSVWNQDIEDALAAAIARDGMSADWTRGAVEALAARKNDDVVQLLMEEVSKQSKEVATTDLAVYSAGILLRHFPDRVWDRCWQRVIADENFGRKLIEGLASDRSQNFISILSEDHLTELFIWTARQYPLAEDPKHEGAYSVTVRDEVARFRDTIPRYLASLGTLDAISGLARARSRLAGADWLKYYEANARTNAHRNAWGSATPDAILAFGSRLPEESNAPNRMIDFAVSIVLSLVAPLAISFQSTFMEKTGISTTIALFSLWLFQLPERRRSSWFPLVTILLWSALTMEAVYFAWWR